MFLKQPVGGTTIGNNSLSASFDAEASSDEGSAIVAEPSGIVSDADLKQLEEYRKVVEEDDEDEVHSYS